MPEANERSEHRANACISSIFTELPCPSAPQSEDDRERGGTRGARLAIIIVFM